MLRLGAMACALCIGGHAVFAGPSWDWQLTEPYDLTRAVDVISLDPYNHDPKEIAALKARGVKLVCYVSVGTWEPWREDAGEFPEEVLGKPLPYWPDERYLNVRRYDLLLPIMTKRLERCAALGFDAVEPDNIDLASNDNGLDLPQEVVLEYITLLAARAHALGLEVGQKNAPELVPDLIGFMDFAVVESCFHYGWCEAILPYVVSGKPVFAAEYTDADTDFDAACAWGAEHGVSFIRKDRDLTSYREACR